MAQGQNTIVSRGVYCMCSMYCMAQRILNWILESVKIWILGWAFHNTYSQSTKNLRWIYSVVLTKAKVVWATRGNSRPRRHNFVLFWLPPTCKWTLLTLIVDKKGLFWIGIKQTCFILVLQWKKLYFSRHIQIEIQILQELYWIFWKDSVKCENLECLSTALLECSKYVKLHNQVVSWF